MSNTDGDVNVREVLLQRLTPGIPKTWRIVPTQRSVDKVGKTTLVVRQQRITKDPDAPAAGRRAFFDFVIACPLDATGAAELRLDDEVIDFLNAVDAAANVVWTEAEKGIWSDAIPSPAYVVSLFITYERKV
jgi:hypothetical protein